MAITQILPPSGGSLYLAVEMPQDTLVALGKESLVRWDKGEKRWETLKAQTTRGNPLLITPNTHGAPTQRLARHGGTLWLLNHKESEGFSLWRSQQSSLDVWEKVPLPKRYNRADQGAFVENQDLSIRTALHLQHDMEGEQLFLVDSSRVWQWKSGGWSSVNLEGTGLGQMMGQERLPSVLRHYLPRREGRDFEILVTLSNQLSIFRRQTPDAPWVLTTTLGVLSQEIQSSPDGKQLYILTPDSLYRSDQFAEMWERVKVQAPSPDDSANHLQHLLILPAQDASKREPPTLILARRDGQLLRSKNEGVQWERLEGPQGTHKVTSLSASTKSVWATIRGQGLLYSRDAGQSWQPRTEGIEGSNMNTFDALGTSLFVGTDVGFFSLDPGSLVGTDWKPLHREATSAIASVRAKTTTNVSHHVTGTPTGMIVLTPLESTELPKTDETDPKPQRHQGLWPTLAQDRQLLYRPSWQDTQTTQPQGIVDFHTSPDESVWFGVTDQANLFRSQDGGISWESYSLPEELQQALVGMRITDMEIASKTTYYLTTQTLNREPSIAQVWQSTDSGKRWQTLWTGQEPLGEQWLAIDTLTPKKPQDGQILVLSHNRRLLKSRDQGKTWKEFVGPWTNQTFVGVHQHGAGTMLVVTKEQEMLSLYDISNPASDDPSVTHYIIRWPRTKPTPSKVRIQKQNGLVYLQHKGELWSAQRLARGGKGDNVTILLLFAASLALSALGYVGVKLVLKKNGRRRI